MKVEEHVTRVPPWSRCVILIFEGSSNSNLLFGLPDVGNILKLNMYDIHVCAINKHKILFILKGKKILITNLGKLLEQL